MNQPTPKKEPYTGDPNATLTICPKKLRRHLRSDVFVSLVPNEATANAIQSTDPHEPAEPKFEVIFLCKHCKQDPVYPVEVDVQDDA